MLHRMLRPSMWLRLRPSLVEPRDKVEHSLTFFVWLSVIPMRINRQILKIFNTLYNLTCARMKIAASSMYDKFESGRRLNWVFPLIVNTLKPSFQTAWGILCTFSDIGVHETWNQGRPTAVDLSQSCTCARLPRRRSVLYFFNSLADKSR